MIRTGGRFWVYCVPQERLQNICREYLLVHDRMQQSGKLPLPFQPMRGNLLPAKTFKLPVDRTMCYFMNVSDQKIIGIKIHIDGDSWRKSRFRSKISQTAASRAGKVKIEFILPIKLPAIRISQMRNMRFKGHFIFHTLAGTTLNCYQTCTLR